MTAQDYLYMALRKCGQLRPGYQSSAELLADGLKEWNSLFDGWNAERTKQFTIPDYIFQVNGVGSATIASGQMVGSGFVIYPTAGAGIDFVSPVPTEIVRCNLYLSAANPGQPVRIPLHRVWTAEEWAAIPVPNLTPINVCTDYYYERRKRTDGTMEGIIWTWPPLNSNSLEIFTYGNLQPPASLSDDFYAPPGYMDAIIYSLAERLWPLCTRDVMVHKVSQVWLIVKADLAIKKLERINRPKPRLVNDFGSNRGGTTGDNAWDLTLTGRPY